MGYGSGGMNGGMPVPVVSSQGGESKKSWVDEYTAHRTDKNWKPTEISEAEEKDFVEWMKNTELVQREAADNPNVPIERIVEVIARPDADYDYRGAWRDGVQTKADKHDGGRQHFSSRDSKGRMLKSPTHNTAWKEFFMSETGQDPSDLGLKTFEQAVEWTQKQGE